MSENKAKLFGFYTDQDNETFTKLTINVLALFGIEKILEHKGEIIVEHRQTWWFLCDNGGEINVGQINRQYDTMQSIASTSNRTGLTPYIMATRIAGHIKGTGVDYDFDAKIGDSFGDGVYDLVFHPKF